MKKNGFTLVELLGVIVIVALISLLVVPKITERFSSKQREASEAAKEVLYAATREYITSNQSQFSTGAAYFCVSIKELINNGNLINPVIDVENGSKISNSTKIDVTVENNQYRFAYNTQRCLIYDLDKPEIAINIDVNATKTSATIKINVTDEGESGLSNDNQYQYYISTSKDILSGGQWKSYTNNSSFIVSLNSSLQYYLWLYSVKDNANNYNDEHSNIVAYCVKAIISDDIDPSFALELKYNNLSTAVAKITVSDDNSGLSSENQYKYYLSTSNVTQEGGSWQAYQSGQNFTMIRTGGNYYLWVYPIKDNAGNISYGLTDVNIPFIIQEIFLAPTSYEYAYTGEIEEFVVPMTGYYKLEVWGAQGGDITFLSGNTNHSTLYNDSGEAIRGVISNGGKGGYSVGVYNATQGETLYVVVGGRGAAKHYHCTNYYGLSCSRFVYDEHDGYNGGGQVAANNPDGARGGGATHIAKQSGLLASFSSNPSAVLIVAGGGGGSYWYNYHSSTDEGVGVHGGSGGGLIGGDSSKQSDYAWGTGGNQYYTVNSHNGASWGNGGNPKWSGGFGFGGIGYSTGGGGYYGGGGGGNGAGGGGSGFIDNVISYGNVTKTTTNDQRLTDGYAIITYISP